MRKRSRLVAFGAAAAAAVFALAACSPIEEDGAAPGGATGLEACEDDPNTCNSGERAEGGEISWIVDSLPGAWWGMSPEGGSVYTLQAINGILPHTGQWAPDGETYEHNMDLLAAEPELLSEEPFSYQFELRPEAVWNDGTPISSADFEITWKMATSEAEGHCEGCRSRSPGSFDRIESVEGDGSTVTVTLKEGNANPEWFGFLDAHSITGGVYPAHIAEEEGFDIESPAGVGEYFEWLNGTMPTFSGGPYVLAEGDLENQMIKEPNPEWYGEVDPTLETVIMRFIADEGTWIQAFSNGEVHGTSPATFGEDVLTQAQEMPNLQVDIGPGPSWEHVDFNLENEWLEDVELRRAIFTAIDVADINNRTVGQLYPEVGVKTNHLFTEGTPYHVDHLGESGQGSGDPEAALAILEEAGYEFDGTTLTLDGETVGPFRLRATSNAVRDTSTQLIQSYLSEIGVETTIEVADDLGAMLADQDYDIVVFGWSGSPFFVNNPFQYWHSSSASNFGGYANDEVDELTDSAVNAVSLDEAAEFANQAMEIVTEDAYVLPLMETPVYIIVSDEYTNVRDNPSSSLRGLYNHHEWGLVAQ